MAAGLPTRRLKTAGIATAELEKLRGNFEAASVEQKELVLAFFGGQAASDLKEWLETQRTLGYFLPGRVGPNTDPMQASLDAQLVGAGAGIYIPLGEKGEPNGVGTLDGEGHQPISQLPSLVVPGSGPSPRAQAQALQTLLEPLTVTFTEEAATTISNPVEITALSGTVLNPNAPWVYQQADMGPKSGTVFAVPLQPYVNRVVNGVFPYQIMFDFDGETFGMHFSNGEKNGRIRIWANDQPTKYFEMPKRAGYFCKVNFGSRAQRRIIIEADFNVFFAGLIRSKPDTIAAPSEYSTRSLAVMGDSFGRGSGILFLNSEATASSQSYAYTLGRLLGFTQTRNWSVPGTGFVKGEGAGTYAERLTSCLSTYKPSVLLLQGSTNDHTFTAAEVESGVTAAVNAVRSESPSTKIIGCTVVPINNEARTENATNAEGLRKAFTALGVPFADGYKAEWITGTGKEGATTGEGNSDFYSSSVTAGHPSLAGHNYLAQRLAQALAPSLNIAL